MHFELSDGTHFSFTAIIVPGILAISLPLPASAASASVMISVLPVFTTLPLASRKFIKCLLDSRSELL